MGIEKSLLSEINAAEEMPPEYGMAEKRTSICFFSIGITAGTIGGTKMKTATSMDEKRPEGDEEGDECEGDEFI